MNAKIKTILMGIVLSLFVLSACVTRTPEPAPATAAPDTASIDNPSAGMDTMLSADDPAYTGPDEIQNKAVDLVRNKLASQLKVEATTLDLVSVEPIDWADACLGEPQEGEMCAQVITPGFRITFSSGGQNYTYHTDKAAGVIRQETKVTQIS